METNAEFLENVPQKTPENLRIEYEMMDFIHKVATRLTIGVEKTLGRCMDFYKKVITMHNRCRTSSEKETLGFSRTRRSLEVPPRHAPGG